MSLRERALVAALRTFPGPIATIAPGPRTPAAKFFDFVLPGVISDPESALTAIRTFEKETGRIPAGIVPFIDGGLYAALAIAEHYGLPFLTRDAVETSSINKNLMKDRLTAHGIATPRYVKVADAAGVQDAIDQVGLPCVIKPCAFGGSLGVRLVRDRDAAAEAFAYVADIIDRTAATFTVRNRSIQVEEFCPLTDEVSVEVLNHHDQRVALAVVDKAVGEPPFFAEVGHRVPSRYSDRSDVREMAVAACAAIGLDHGMAHVEIRLEAGAAPQLIEVGSRTAGDGILDLVEAVYGMAPYELHVRSYLEQLDEMPEPHEATGVAALAVLKAPGGTIAEVRTPAEVDPAVSDYEVSVAAGDTVSPVSANYLTREGYVECRWLGADPASVPPTAHLEIADKLSGQLFRMTD